MASFRQHDDKTWEYRIRYKDIYTGKYKEKSKRGFKRKADAQHEADKVSLTLANGFVPKSDNQLFSQYVQSWYKVNEKLWRYNTARLKQQAINRINGQIGNVPIKSLSFDIIQRYLSYLNEMDLSRSTIEADYDVIRGVAIKAMRENLIADNILLGIKIPDGKRPREIRWWTIDTFKEFFDKQNARIEKLSNTKKQSYMYSSIRDLTMIYIMGACGLRVGEVCGLLTSSYDGVNHIIKVHHNLTATKTGGGVRAYQRQDFLKTNSSYREVPMPETAWQAVDRWLEVRSKLMGIPETKSDHSMFMSSQTPEMPIIPTRVDAQLTEICKRFDLPSITPHGLRHTYASFLYQSNVPAKQAQMLLGHSTIRTTLDTYTHVSKNDNRKAINLLEKYLA